MIIRLYLTSSSLCFSHVSYGGWNEVDVDLHRSSVFMKCLTVFITWGWSDDGFWFTEGAFWVVPEYSAASGKTNFILKSRISFESHRLLKKSLLCENLISIWHFTNNHSLHSKCTFGRNILNTKSGQYQLRSSRSDHMILQFLWKCDRVFPGSIFAVVFQAVAFKCEDMLLLFYICDSKSHIFALWSVEVTFSCWKLLDFHWRNY